MRPTVVVCGLMGAILAVTPALAQNAPAPPKYKEMVVTAQKVEVRCGGVGPNFYATSTLQQGDRVLVIKPSEKFKGFLEIKPPPGSFSWINNNHIQRRGQYEAVVLAGDDTPSVPVLAGSSIFKDRPTVFADQLSRGTLVVILDKSNTDSEGVWWPIQPTAREVRYIPSDAVRDLSPGQMPLYPQGAPAPSPLGAGVVAGAPPTLLTQANQAYQSHDLPRAKQLYLDAANQSKVVEEQTYCYGMLSRIASESHAAQQPGYPAASTTAVGPAPGQNTALYNTPAGATAQPVSRTTDASTGPAWSGWGILRKANFSKDGQPMYVLENRANKLPPLYAATPPNLTLEGRVGQWVCLYGQLSYHSDDALRSQYMIVSHVALPPAGAAIPRP